MWANSNGVSDTKYNFTITYSPGTSPVKYALPVPNVTEVYFSDLIAQYSMDLRNTDLYNIEASEHTFTITQGNTVRKTFTIADPTNQPIDLTAWTAIIYLIDTEDPNWNLKINLPTVAAEGKIQLHMNTVTTWGLGNRDLKYELYIFNVNDTIKLLHGSIHVIPSLIQPGV